MSWTKDEIAKRAAEEISSGQIVNLGIGLPTLIADNLGGKDVLLHSENGLLGMGPFPAKGQADPQLINAGKQTVTVVPGGSTFDSSLSFAMIRGGHVDLAFLGALQVSAFGDLANWTIPNKKVMGIGGAMDLAAGAARVIAMCTHSSKKGEAKLVEKCSFPLTASRVVSYVITELGVFEPKDGKFVVVELAPGVTLEQVEGATGGPVVVM